MTSEYITKLKREYTPRTGRRSSLLSDEDLDDCRVDGWNDCIDHLNSHGLIVQEGMVQVPLEYLSQAVEYLSSCPDVMGPDSRCTADFFVSLALAEFEGSKAATQKKED